MRYGLSLRYTPEPRSRLAEDTVNAEFVNELLKSGGIFLVVRFSRATLEPALDEFATEAPLPADLDTWQYA